MRIQLEKINEVRQTFYGTFIRLGYKKSYDKTVLLTDILDTSGTLMSDHVWFNYTKGFQDIEPLVRGDKIRFCARVKQYRKGSVRRGIPIEYDYKLSHPSQIVKIKKSVKSSILHNVEKESRISDRFDLDRFTREIINNNSDDEDLSESGLIDHEPLDFEERLIAEHIDNAKNNIRGTLNNLRNDQDNIKHQNIKHQNIEHHNIKHQINRNDQDNIYKHIESMRDLSNMSHTLRQSSIQNFIRGTKLSVIPVNKPLTQRIQSRLESYFK